MDDLVIRGWEEKRELFCSDFRGTQFETMTGVVGFVKAIDLKRTGNKRKTRYEEKSVGPVTSKEVDLEAFNFTKANPAEFITDEILINTSPLGFGHFLFCPQPAHLFPQILTFDHISRCLEISRRFARPEFRMFLIPSGAGRR